MPGTPGPDPSTARYLEVERKFDVDESMQTPSFEGVATVAGAAKAPAQSLDAVYFDTPAHDLAANLITLRRRTGGTDPGWHLKLPAGPHTRTEVRTPLGPEDDADDNTVPADLRDLVLAVVRDRPLVPVARIATARDVEVLRGADGAALAEFCDDHVTASAIGSATEQRWREWELELTDTDPELLNRLSTRLLATGATPARHDSKLARALGVEASAEVHLGPVHRAVTEQVDQLLVWDRAVREDADDAVHQMRVTIRKIRSLLVPGDGDTWILDELRWLAGVLGVARDAEVLAQRYRRALDRLPAELVRGRVRERLVDTAESHYRAGRSRSLAAMRSPRYFRLLDGLDALVTEPPAEVRIAVSEVPATIDTAYRRVRKAAKAAARTDAEHDEALHRIRKGAKRLRYTAAAMGEPRIAAQAKAIQTLLGDHQDSVVSRTHLLQQVQAAHAAGEDTFTYGLLYQQEADLADSRRAQLDRALADLAEVVGQGGRAGL